MIVILHSATTQVVPSPNPRLPFVRDTYGVPHIKCKSERDTWVACGYAVAEDRMWQMELSRSVARGRLAEIVGHAGLASDSEVVQTGYTDEELQQQYAALSPLAKTAVDAYAEGVNSYLSSHPNLPDYVQHHVQPEPWTPLDSVAIGVRLFQEFGRGGAGALRNLAFLAYLRTRPQLKGRELDVFDDFSWQNDPAAITTVDRAEDPLRENPPAIFPPFDRKVTQERLSEIPPLNLFELLPAIRLEDHANENLVAEQLGAPFKTGSYCVVVAPKRSTSGEPLLMSAPQMGFSAPSILHEMSIANDRFSVTGVDVPGLPGIVIGFTPHFAWGLTSGEADTQDIVWAHTAGEAYIHGGLPTAYEKRSRVIHVLGEPDRVVIGRWTEFGPVLLEKPDKHVVFSRHDAYRGLELRSYDALLSLYDQVSAPGIEDTMASATMSFNFFYATATGDIGYRYLGRVPMRAPGLDPRLPTPDEARYRWLGFVPYERMPHIRNPKSGLLVNWNSKPASWWPNGDTPDWGRIFHASLIQDELRRPKLNTNDLELAAWWIARRDETWPWFQEIINSLPGGLGVHFDGRLIDGSDAAGAYKSWFESFRIGLFGPSLGDLLDRDLFDLVVQPTSVWNAVHHRTKFDYLAGRPLSKVAIAAGAAPHKSYRAGGIRVPGEADILYSNRGTFTQIVEFKARAPHGRNVLSPGEAAEGPHSRDQVPLAREWTYKLAQLLP